MRIILNCQQPSRADGDRIQQTLKNFPRKKSAVTTRQICSISDAAFEYENLRLSKSPLAATHAFSLELLSTQSLGFCSATRLRNVEYFKSSYFNKTHGLQKMLHNN